MAESAAQTSKHPIVEPDDCDHVAVRRRNPTGALVAELLNRGSNGRFGTPAIVLVAVLLGGGSGIGSSWLLGPGGLADASTRERIEANALAIERLTAAVQSCEDSIDDLGDDGRDMQTWTADALLKQNQALGRIATKLELEVDLRLPDLGGRRRR